MRRVTLLSVLAVAGLVLDGCGATALTDSQLRATATRICSLSEARGDDIATPATPAAGVVFIRRGIAAFSPELSDLRTLKVSSGSSPTYETALAALAAELGAMRSALKLLDAGGDPLSTIKRLQRRLEPQESRADLAWRALHIPGCQSR